MPWAEAGEGAVLSVVVVLMVGWIIEVGAIARAYFLKRSEPSANKICSRHSLYIIYTLP